MGKNYGLKIESGKLLVERHGIFEPTYLTEAMRLFPPIFGVNQCNNIIMNE
jgi:hypothetical protein